MTMQETSSSDKVRLCPPPPKGFDPFTATREDLKRHGLPLRPDPQTQPDMAALWERKARRYRNFEHLEPQFEPATAIRTPVIAAAPPQGSFALSPYESCGYELDSSAADPFTAVFVTWTVPDLQYTPNPPVGPDPNLFRTFVTLGSVQGTLDVHVEMTVDAANNVTSQLWAEFVGNVPLPVKSGDVISGSLCLDTQPPGRGAYFFTNETTRQTISFPVTTGLPPATFVLAGVSRGGNFQQLPLPALAQFGVVYFDEISVYTTSGPRSLTSGTAVTMTDQNGNAIATPEKLTDWTFKAVRDLHASLQNCSATTTPGSGQDLASGRSGQRFGSRRKSAPSSRLPALVRCTAEFSRTGPGAAARRRVRRSPRRALALGGPRPARPRRPSALSH